MQPGIALSGTANALKLNHLLSCFLKKVAFEIRELRFSIEAYSARRVEQTSFINGTQRNIACIVLILF